jgi:rubrerythrin
MNQINGNWAYIEVPHDPLHRQYVRCLCCGQTWEADKIPEQCPNCGYKDKSL